MLSPAIFKRRLFLTSASLIILLLFLYPFQVIFAQESEAISQNLGEKITTKNYGPDKNSDFAVTNLFHATLCQLAGTSPVGDCVAYIKTDGGSELRAFDIVPGGGALGGIGRATASLYKSPTSSREYLADIGEHLGLVRTVHAQVGGSGEGIINPVKNIWKQTQKLAFMAFTLVFLATGFMIMFRRKMNPQTVITVQSAIPMLVVGLILVTFSYFISALIVDLSFLGVQLVGNLFVDLLKSGGTNAYGGEQQIRDYAQNSNILHLFGGATGQGMKDLPGLLGGSAGTISSIFSGVGNNIAGGVLAGGLIASMPVLAGMLILQTFNPASLAVVGVGAAAIALVALLVPVALIIILIVQFFRLFFKLLMAYITILVATIFSPFIILFASIPGQGGKLSMWWKTLLANALIFPVVFAGFLFVGVILGDSTQWQKAPPLFGGISVELLKLLVAYGVLLGLPALPDLVKNALGVKDIPGIPQAAIGGFLAGVGITRKGAGAGFERTSWGRMYKMREQLREAEQKERANVDRFGEAPSIRERLRAFGSTGGPIQRIFARVASGKNLNAPETDILRRQGYTVPQIQTLWDQRAATIQQQNPNWTPAQVQQEANRTFGRRP